MSLLIGRDLISQPGAWNSFAIPSLGADLGRVEVLLLALGSASLVPGPFPVPLLGFSL